MSALVKYEAACLALAECKSVDEAKSWTDKAAAMQAYGRMAKDRTLEVDAAEIRIRAERRLGEMLAATKAQGGLNQAATLKRGPVVVSDDHGKSSPKLADSGISKDLSSRAQKLAAVPAAEFEAELSAKRERDKQDGSRVSARLEAAGAKVLRAAKPPADECAGMAEDDTPAVEPPADPRDAQIKALEAKVEHYEAALAAELAENTRIGNVLDADDKVAAAMASGVLLAAENKQLKAQVAQLRERVNGLVGEGTAHVRRIKSLMAKLKKAGLE